VAIGLPGPATAAGTDLSLTLSAPATARVGSNATVRATLLDDELQPVAGANVQLQSRGSDGTWTTIAGSVTTGEGVAGFSVAVPAGALVVRARFGGDENFDPVSSEPATVSGVVVGSSLFIHGPRTLVDETATELLMRWTGADGLPVTGTVAVYQHARNQSWTKLGTTSTGTDGRARVKIRPRVDMTYQFRGVAGPGWNAATSPTWFVDNKPPMAPVTWPSTAPRPLALPVQRRAVGSDANFVAQTIPDSVWSQMVGRSWHSGCPIGRSGLRYVTVNYWGFDGYRHRGELVTRASAAGKFAIALTKLYNAKVPIRAMYLPDRFGRNGNSPGANDVQSMRHDNTSAFNCRAVSGDPGRRSPHSYGGSIDMNPWENPFHSHVGWLPNSWWAHKQAGKYAWKTRSHPVVQMMGAAGFRWTYGTSDSQHFDG
jgi:hypothetical protein